MKPLLDVAALFLLFAAQMLIMEILKFRNSVIRRSVGVTALVVFLMLAASAVHAAPWSRRHTEASPTPRPAAVPSPSPTSAAYHLPDEDILRAQTHASPAPKPIILDGYALRTVQEDMELEDWISGIQKVTTQAQQQTKGALASQADTNAAFNAAIDKLDGLQTRIDALQKERDNALAAKAKLQHQNAIMSTVIAAEAAIAALFVCLWLKVPELDMPWGIVVTFGAPAVVFGAVKLFLRFIL